MGGGTDRADVLPVGGDELGRRPERLVGNAHHGLRPSDVLSIEREAVRLEVVGVIGRRVTDVAAQDQQVRPAAVVGLRRLECLGQTVEVLGHLTEVVNVPAVRGEPPGRVVTEGERRRTVDRDAVVVVDADQPPEPEVTGERRRLMADALHHAPVSSDDERVMVDRLLAEPGAQDPLGDRHPDGVGEALPERAGGHLDARGVASLWVAGRPRLELAELLQVVELEAVPGQVQQRVLQNRRMAVGQHEPVAVGPFRIGGIVLHDPRVEDVAERRQRHRRALVPAVRLERSVHRHAADQRDGLLGLFGRQRRGHRSDCTRPLPGDTWA